MPESEPSAAARPRDSASDSGVESGDGHLRLDRWCREEEGNRAVGDWTGVGQQVIPGRICSLSAVEGMSVQRPIGNCGGIESDAPCEAAGRERRAGGERTPETREHYRLEDLWSDVPKLEAAATA